MFFSFLSLGARVKEDLPSINLSIITRKKKRHGYEGRGGNYNLIDFHTTLCNRVTCNM